MQALSHIRKKKLQLGCIIVVIAMTIYIGLLIASEESPPNRSNHWRYVMAVQNNRYFINTSACKIPDIGAFNEEIMPFYRKLEGDVGCLKYRPLTYLTRMGDYYTLHINKSLIEHYSNYGLRCCYSKVEYISDDEISVAGCEPFEDGIIIKHDVIKVKCTNYFLYGVYSNVHALVMGNNSTKTKLKRNLQNKREMFSVTMIGIDSVSHLNLMRSMPETYYYLKNANFINLKGYNKVGDNTFPNLIPILSGKTAQQYYAINNLEENVVNNSLIIWHSFSKFGYITAYCEDKAVLSTFNYGRRGFGYPPTDFYFRSYFLAIEDLDTSKVEDAYICTGPESTSERVFYIAHEFVDKFKDIPTFSLFWMTSYSHDDINGATILDSQIKDSLKGIVDKLLKKNSFLIFFSDHGFRFGEARNTYAGWLEERLPFIYILVPDQFKRLYPEKYENLLTNTNRLTSPFDLHMTLQEILALSDDTYQINPSQGCPTCHSLFTMHKEDRTCHEAGVISRWCTCMKTVKINNEDPLAKAVVEFAVRALNNLIENRPKCAIYQIESITQAFQTADEENGGNDITVIFTTKPKAQFEATVEVKSISQTNRFRLKGEISRISRYGPTSKCEDDKSMKPYCYCDAKRAIDSFIN